MQDSNRERLNLAKDILLGIALAGGAVMLLAVAPGLGAILGPATKKYHRRSLESARIKRNLKKLVKEGLIGHSEQNGKTKLYLTKAGKQKVLEYEVDSMTIPKQTPWDGKYRFVMFDIPEKQRLSRNVFRKKLVDLGFKKIQHSIWYHKYPCSDQIEFLINLYQVEKYVTLVEGIEAL